MGSVQRVVLGKTYFNQGFFNVSVRHSAEVRPDEGPIEVEAGAEVIEAWVNRTANPNGTPRVMGGNPLRRWIQQHARLNDLLLVEFVSPRRLRLSLEAGGAGPGLHQAPREPKMRAEPERPPAPILTEDQLGQLRRDVVRLLRRIDPDPPAQEPVGATAGRLVREGRIPREVGGYLRSILELRNRVEYQGVPLTHAESTVVRANWAAICEWARSAGLLRQDSG